MANLNLGYFDDDGHWFLSEDDRKCLHKAFQVFYKNRLAYEELKNIKYNWDYSFKPKILGASEHFAKQYRDKQLKEVSEMIEKNNIAVPIPSDGKITHSDLLILMKKKTEVKIK